MVSYYDDEWPTPADFQDRETFGEILPNGSILDVLAPRRYGLELVFFVGGVDVIDSSIMLPPITYKPPRLSEDILAAVRFPRGIAEYESVEKLMSQLRMAFPPDFFSSESDNRFWAFIGLISWIPERFPILPTIIVTGRRRDVLALFDLLSCICRRALLLGELGRSLPFKLNFTALVSQCDMSTRQRRFWKTSDSRKLVIPKGHNVIQPRIMKIVFEEDPSNAAEWGADAIHFTLQPGKATFLSEHQLTELALRLQPQLQLFRLRHLAEWISKSTSQTRPSVNGSLLRPMHESLQLVAQEIGQETALMPFFESQREEIQEQQDSDPDIAVLKSIWAPAHEGGDMKVADIRTRVNALLLSHGAPREMNEKQIGWRIKQLGMERDRTADYKFLRFTPELIAQIHLLVERFELNLPQYEDCDICVPTVVEPAVI